MLHCLQRPAMLEGGVRSAPLHLDAAADTRAWCNPPDAVAGARNPSRAPNKEKERWEHAELRATPTLAVVTPGTDDQAEHDQLTYSTH
jgi:hypothetical protein